jgi:hypothetical protein
MKNKLHLIKMYLNIQAHDDALWFEAIYITEAYLQEQLRTLCWIIEEATNEQIQKAIDEYIERL